MNYYRVQTKLPVSRIINNGVKRAIRERLLIILAEEQRQQQFWHENVAPRLNPTRKKQVIREANKRIQALKIVIYMLTPFYERTEDVPTFVKKDGKN
ncbi:hypothetical protein UFOVP402_58 [uncultured Caudovirales phage]|uniref:Uncharacterized protein n=1 Tax=uncultured Caudovirales phage TaxID=2100421 RepID=A0A6J5M173_9CAUD|nr:hypothetical protein UFOVP402_58 [uncultured Caudovirales phage]